MNDSDLPVAHHADDTRPYAGPGRGAGHAIPNPDAGHEGPHLDLEPIGTGKVILFAAVLGVLFAVLLVLGLLPRHDAAKRAEAEASSAQEARLVVGVVKPKPPTTMPALEVPGDAQALQATEIYPRASGYLKRRLVDIGDHVTEGQLLAEIDAPEVVAQLDAAKANLQQVSAAATKAKDDYDLAESTYQRYEGFAKTGGVTQQQLDEKKSALTSANSTLAGANANVKADQAQVERLTALVGYTQITAPFSGIITTRGYDTGALLSANNGGGRELFEIQQVDTMRVFVDIPQTYVTGVKVGQAVKFIVSNPPLPPFDGYIARTSGAINQQTRTMRVEADFPNKEGLLYPNMYGTLHYDVHQKVNPLVIPTSALVFDANGMRVGVVDDENKIRFRPVQIGVDLGTEVEITQGLKGDERVVANPGERLADGVEVQIVENKPTPQNPAQTPPGNNDNKGAARVAEASGR